MGWGRGFWFFSRELVCRFTEPLAAPPHNLRDAP